MGAITETIWRRVRKFPDYEISSEKEVRSIRYDRIAQQVDNSHLGESNTVTLMKGWGSFVTRVDELFYDAYPELRGR